MFAALFNNFVAHSVHRQVAFHVIYKNVRFVIQGTFFKKRRLMQLQCQKAKEIVRGYVQFPIIA